MTETAVSVASPVPSSGSSQRLAPRHASAAGHVALLHFGRAGSTVLLDLLSQSEGLLNGREPFVGYHGEYRERMRRVRIPDRSGRPFQPDLGTDSGAPGHAFRRTWARIPEHLGTRSDAPGQGLSA